MMVVHSLLAVWTLVVLSRAVCAKESAWNGYVTPGSTTVTTFTPYYVPPGAKSYDSSSPLLHYSGTWTDSYSTAFVQKALRTTSQENASLTFTFTGTGIEWFGNEDVRHGIAKVYMDGKLIQSVDAYNSVCAARSTLAA